VSDDVADREHPAAEKLSAYLANELSAEENDRIEEHVASCSLCAERLLDLQRFLEFAPDQSREGDLETEAEWRKLQDRIKIERGSQARAATGRGRVRRVLISVKTAYGLAAMLTIGLVGLSMYTVRLRQELRSPGMNSRAVFLSSLTLARGLEDQVKTIDLAPHEEARIAFSLEAPHAASFPAYRLEVKDIAGRLIVARDDLRKQDDAFVFILPTEGLSDGRYSIAVRGLREAERPPAEVGRYEFRIRRS
jgi:anti-sigma factor RsiW